MDPNYTRPIGSAGQIPANVLRRWKERKINTPEGYSETEGQSSVTDAVARKGYDLFTTMVVERLRETGSIAVNEWAVVIRNWDDASSDERGMWRKLAQAMITEYIECDGMVDNR
jgi:hypothetical protein